MKLTPVGLYDSRDRHFYFSASTVFVPAGNPTGHDALWRTTSALIGPWHELAQLQTIVGLEQPQHVIRSLLLQQFHTKSGTY